MNPNFPDGLLEQPKRGTLEALRRAILDIL
jgi:hypothetical protein